jgi:ketosteroid isomerase-like protein
MASNVLDSEDRRWAAMIANDLDALGELLHPQLSYTHSNALMDSKESYIASLANGVVRYMSVDREDTAVTEIGDTAVITGTATFTVHARGTDITINSRYSSVWLKNDGRWQFFVWHNTPFPK